VAEEGANVHGDGPPALRVQGVRVALGGRDVIDDVSLTLREGQVLALLGPNGAGKTSLLRAIAGLTAFTGRIEVLGLDVRTAERRALARAVAMVPQRSLLEARLPVRTVVAQGRYAHAAGFGPESAADEAAVERAMAQADVAGLADRVLPELSHGEQRRVLLARALCTEARVLLLDEPTAALDLPHALALSTTLRELARAGHAVVLVLHQLDEALRSADRCALIDRGRLVTEGPAAEVVLGEHVARVYEVDVIAGGGLGFRLRGGER
jgi:iron complex transport system ATP-binding protein